METNDMIVAIVPALATGAATYAVARAHARAEAAKQHAASHATVEVAEIEAHTADQRILLEYMQVADKRHAMDVDRLYSLMDKAAKLETEVALLREKLTQTEVEVLILRGQLEQAGR